MASCQNLVCPKVQHQSRWVSFRLVSSLQSQETKNPAPQVMDQLEEQEVVDVIDDGFPPEDPEPRPDKRRKAENTLVQQLGTDPKKVRSDARASL